MGRALSEDLRTGFVLIDRQHEDLYERIQQLLSLLSEGSHSTLLQSTFEFLEGFAVVHFDFEETAMNMFNYPERHAHIAEHAQILANIRLMRGEALSGGVTTALVERTRELLVDTLLHHIHGYDAELAVFLRKESPDGWLL